MDVTPRLPYWAAVMLLAAPFCGCAQTSLPDPVAPAVVGRPLDQIRPTRPARAKAVAEKPAPASAVAAKAQRPAHAAAASKAVPTPTPAAAAIAPPAAVMGNSASPRPAKTALDDRTDTQVAVANDVGKGSHLARKPLDPGAYIGSKYQALVRQYYDAHPPAGKSGRWRIGEPVPPKVAVTGVPDALRAKLPMVPPGHQYVQVDGEVVLLAVQSRMVVDGVSRNAR